MYAGKIRLIRAEFGTVLFNTIAPAPALSRPIGVPVMSSIPRPSSVILVTLAQIFSALVAVAVADALTPPPPVISTVTGFVYPSPPLTIVILVTDPAVTTALAVAPDPVPLNVTVGVLVYPLPPFVIVRVVPVVPKLPLL